MASWRCLAAATVISKRSLTLNWPVNSENRDGRSVISNAASGFANTSEILCSAIASRMGKEWWGARLKVTAPRFWPRQVTKSERGQAGLAGNYVLITSLLRRYDTIL